MTATGLADTSVFIAAEGGRPLDTANLPEHLVISVVTHGELQAGVLAAADAATRSRRLATLLALDEVETLPIDLDVARVWAQMRVHLAESGRRLNVNDLWIAATAAARELPVITQDAGFEAVAGVHGLIVVRV